MRNLAVVAVFSIILCAGCSKAESDDETVSVTPGEESIPFEGKTDPGFASTWQTPDGKSTLVLNRDGTAHMKSNVATPGGAHSADIPAQWRSGDGTLMFKTEDGKTFRYFVEKKAGDAIELRRLKDSKIKLLYRRKV